MRRPLDLVVLEEVCSKALIRLTSLLIPSALRSEWVREWEGELWHVQHAMRRQSPTLYNNGSIMGFGLGSIRDAIELCWSVRSKGISVHWASLSAARCLLYLSAIELIAVTAALFLSQGHLELPRSRFVPRTDLVFLFKPSARDESVATVTPRDYRAWLGERNLLTEAGYYQISRENVAADKGNVNIPLAHATQDLISIFNIRFDERSNRASSLPQLVLSDALWHQLFRRDNAVIGKIVDVSGRPVIIRGVASLGGLRLPGDCGAWLFEPDTRQGFQDDRLGYVLGILSMRAPHNWYFDVGHTKYAADERHARSVLYFPLAERVQPAWPALCLGMLLGILALPATTSLGLGQYVKPCRSSSIDDRIFRSLYFHSKVVLVLLIAPCTGLILSSFLRSNSWRAATELAVFATFGFTLAGLRWSIQDQRKRCPICLNVLRYPARVGDVSRIFLSWNGMELVCERGHGLLHIPDFATTWFPTQRWLTLDGSWAALFAEKL